MVEYFSGLALLQTVVEVFSSHFGDGGFFKFVFALGRGGGIIRFIPMVDGFLMFRFSSGRSEGFL